MAWTYLECTKHTWTLIFLILCIVRESTAKYHLPIGLLYDSRSGSLPQAVREEVEKANMQSHSLHFMPRDVMVDATDSFNVSRALCELLSSGAIILMGSVGRSTLDTVKAYSDSLGIPFVFLNNPSDPRVAADPINLSLQFFMQPSVSRVIVDVIQSYEWPKLLYVYSTDEALFRLEQVHDYIHDYPYAPEIVARHVQNRSACFQLLKVMHEEDKSKDIRLVLDMDPEDVQWVIQTMLAEETMYKIRFHFVLPFLSLRYISLKAFKTGGVNITGFELFPDNHLAHFLRPRVKQQLQWKSDRILAGDAMHILTESLTELQRHHGSLFSGVNGWQDSYSSSSLITCQPATRSSKWRYGRDLAREFTKRTFTGGSGPIRFLKSGHRSGHSLEVIEVGMYRGVAEAGTWTEDRFEPKQPEQIYDKTNRTIDNRTRIVISIADKPYIFNATKPQAGVPIVGRFRFYGYCAELAEMVSRIVGYEYHIRLVRDGKYGSPNGDGTWNGMIGELIVHEADIAFAPLTITSDREKVLDFTKPFMSLGISIMIKRPAENENRVFSFMEPLSNEIWLCTVFAFIGVSVVLFLVSRFSSEEWNVDGGEGKLSNDFTIGNSLWFSLGAFMQQGCDVLPKSVSGRIVTSVWWFFTLIIISSYTANLAAYLTTMRMSTPIQSAEDLAKQTEIKYGTLAGGSTNDFFNQTRVSLYQRMWSFMTSQKNVFVKNNNEGIEKVRNSNGKYAFLIESTTNEYFNKRKPCDTMKVGANLDSKGYGVATPMGSDIRDWLTLAILELREHGELEELKKEWWDKRSECPEEKTAKESTDNALTLTKVAGIFYILVAGLALSVISVVLEFLYKTKVDSRRQNISFGSEARSKFRLSISGHSDDESMGQRTPLRATGATGTFTYTACDGQPRQRTQTVV